MNVRARRVVALCMTLAASTQAQSMTGEPVVDSAGVARVAFARGGVAFRAGSLDLAQRELLHAATAWPSQSAYVWALAAVAATRHDTATTLAALERAVLLGAPRSALGDPRYAFLTSHPRFIALASSLDSLAAPAPRSTRFRTIADSTLWPEGVDCTPTAGTCYVSSVAHRQVFAVTADGIARSVVVAGAPLPGPATAVRLDATRGRLWVATSHGVGPAPRGTARAALALVDLASGRIERLYELPDGGSPHVLGDLAVSTDGDVLISDSGSPALYLLRRGAAALLPVRHVLFRSLQGVTFVPGTSFAIVADYSHGLLRVDLRTRLVRRLDDAPGGSSLGIDGLAWYHGTVVGVQNGVAPPRVVQFDIDPSLERITTMRVLDRNLPVADEPTSGSIVGDTFIYVANSSWEKHDEAGRRTPGSRLVPPVLLRLSLPPRPRG